MLYLSELTKVGKWVRHLCNCFAGNDQCRCLLLADFVCLHRGWIWKRCSGTDILSMMWSTTVSLQIRSDLNLFWSTICLFRLQFCTWYEKTFFFARWFLGKGPVWTSVLRGMWWAFTDWSTWRVVEWGLPKVVAYGVLDFLSKSKKRVSQIFEIRRFSFAITYSSNSSRLRSSALEDGYTMTELANVLRFGIYAPKSDSW